MESLFLLDSSITYLAEGSEGDSDLEVSPASLCPLPFMGTSLRRGQCVETPFLPTA